MNVLTAIFGRGGYLPHGYCFSWTPGLLWSMVLADGTIACAYFSIPVAIVTFARRRKLTSGLWATWLFAAFILACGVTHAMDIWTVWQPDYALQALSKAVTAAISIVAAGALWILMPGALKIPTVQHLQSLIAALEAEVLRRRTIEESLVEVEQSLAVTLASIGAGFLSTDREGRVTRLNAVAERLLGWPEHAARGMPFWTVFAREDRDAARSAMNPVDVMIRDSITADIAHQFEVTSRSGTRIPVEAKGALTYRSDGEVRGLALVFRDVSQQIKAEEDSNRLARIVESSFDAIIGKRLDGVITSWNPGAERLFGYAASEAVGQPMQMLIPESRASEEREILSRLARGERVDHFETIRRRKDGSMIHVSASISPVRDATGRVIGASKIARDISERKQADARLLAQLQRLRLLDQITRAIGERQDLRSIYQVAVRSLEDQLPADFSCVLDHDRAHGRLVLIGVGARPGPELLSLGSPIEIDINGLSPCIRGELVYLPDAGKATYPFGRLLAGAGLHSVIAAPLRSEGACLGVLIAARRAPDSFDSGECEFVSQLSSQVGLAAHQAQLYAEVQAALKELRQTQDAALQQERLRALGQMASGIAHDINNALSPAVLYAEALLDGDQVSERAKEQIRIIARAVDDVAATVARMREFYRTREPQIRLLPVAMNDLVRQAIDMSRARWSNIPQRRGIMIDIVTDLADALPLVWGVESEIREILINLLFNAVDAMPNGGSLSLRTSILPAPGSEGSATPVRVAVDVSDTGIGMDEETQRHCLEPFFTTKGERGTGLGLAMVYGIAKRHRAEIAIESAPGSGTTVRVIFPAEPQEVVHPEPVMEMTEHLYLLVVDDDPALLQSLQETLGMDGHEVKAANGGQRGIDAFLDACASARPFDVVITDLGMPHVDGRSVAAVVKKHSAGTPVILLTGWGQQMDEDGDVPPHVDLVLSKPPRLSSLRAGLAKCRARISRK